MPAPDRYARHRVLPDFGPDAQDALEHASVLVVGLGGLGVPAATYLAAAGVGRLLLNDFDVVDLTNLQRQPLYRTGDIGARKVATATTALQALNDRVRIEALDGRLEPALLASTLAGVDLVVDCTDNFGTRFALNEAAFAARKPLVSGAAIRWDGHLTVFDARSPASPCYACLYSEHDEGLEDCRSNGVLGPVVGVVGCLLAVEAIKVIIGAPDTLVGRLLRYDARQARFHEARLDRDPACAVCGSRAGDT